MTCQDILACYEIVRVNKIIGNQIRGMFSHPSISNGENIFRIPIVIDHEAEFSRKLVRT